MTTWIQRFDQPVVTAAGSIRVAVKDAIDMAGLVTTAGCVAVRNRAVPASADAACLAGFRAAGDYAACRLLAAHGPAPSTLDEGILRLHDERAGVHTTLPLA